jgi:hypothetical protein
MDRRSPLTVGGNAARGRRLSRDILRQDDRDVMILEIFLPNNWQKMVFLTQNKAFLM